jgi:hypothetical protein
MWTGQRAYGIAAGQGIVGEAEPRAAAIATTRFTLALALDIRALEPRRRARRSRGQRCPRRRTAGGERGRASRVIGAHKALEMTRRAGVHPVAFVAWVVPVLARGRGSARIPHGGFHGRACPCTSILVRGGVQRAFCRVRRGIDGWCAGVAGERSVRCVHRGPGAAAARHQCEEHHRTVPPAHARLFHDRGGGASALGAVRSPRSSGRAVRLRGAAPSRLRLCGLCVLCVSGFYTNSRPFGAG